MKVKIFEGDSEELEEEINEWLKEHSDVEIKFVKQSEAGSLDGDEWVGNTTISLFYAS